MYTRYIIGKCLQMFSDSNICVAYQIQYDMQIKVIYIYNKVLSYIFHTSGFILFSYYQIIFRITLTYTTIGSLTLDIYIKCALDLKSYLSWTTIHRSTVKELTRFLALKTSYPRECLINLGSYLSPTVLLKHFIQI